MADQTVTENRARHTPGPWLALPSAHAQEFTYWIERHAGAYSRTVIAAVLNEKDSEANARVIAAAPELLELVRRVGAGLCLFDHLNPCWDGRPTDQVGRHWGGKADACLACTARGLVAKVEGR